MGFSIKLRNMLDMIKFEHTIFALPFAYLGMVLGARGLPRPATFLWISLAMVGARSYAMALNRICDLKFDKQNPRTSKWPLSRGLVTVKETLGLALISLVLFFIAVYRLPELCRLLWPFVLLPMSFYSLAKRVTWFSHLFLGLCLGLAPLGAWVATTNTLPSAGIWALGLAVLFWTAGFDIIYSCQDYSFDRNEGLHSIPVRFGLPNALRFSKVCHVLTIMFLAVLGSCFSLGTLYFSGIALIALFLWYENHIVRPDDLSKVNMSFFTLNGFVSIFTFVFTFIAIVL